MLSVDFGKPFTEIFTCEPIWIPTIPDLQAHMMTQKLPNLTEAMMSEMADDLRVHGRDVLHQLANDADWDTILGVRTCESRIHLW